MSFRSRTILVVATTTIVTLGAAFAGVGFAFRKALDDELDVALRAQAVEEASETATLGGERLALPESSGFFANDVEPLSKAAVLYDASGGVLAKTATFPCAVPARGALEHPPGEPFALECAGVRLRAVMATIPRHPGSAILIAAPRAALEGDVPFLRRAMLATFVIAVLWSILAARIVAGPIVRDHEEISAVLRRAAGGDLSARVGRTSRDREILRLASDVDETIARLGGLVDAQRRFVANAAHELRSPLTALYGELQQALRRPRDADEYRRAIAESIDSTRRLLHLAEDLLALARVGSISSGEAADVSLLEIATAAAATTAGVAEGAHVHVDVRGEPVLVHGRPIELQRLVRNVIENAIAHSPTGGRVEVEVTAAGERAAISVSDEGSGVEEADRERVFEPFYRSARSRSQGAGTGLGLSIAREIARAHDGDVTLEPSARGARFVVTIARAPSWSERRDDLPRA